MKSLALILVLVVLVSILMDLKAQTTEIDSLENLLQQRIEDTVRINLLNKVADKVIKINIDKTLTSAKEAEKLATKIEFAKGKAESLRLIGVYYSYKSNYSKALEYYIKSLKINEKLNAKKEIARCFNYIGYIHRKQNNFPKALTYFQKALKINKELEIKTGITYSLHNMGIIYNRTGNYSKALEYFQTTLTINKELGIKKGISYSLNSTGEVFYNLGDYTKAIEYFQKALKIRTEIGNKYLICISNQDLGLVYLKTNNYSKALNYSLKSLKIAKDLNLLENQKDIHKQLSEIYANTKNYKKAYENYILYKKLNDRIFNEESIKKITGLEYQYKYEKEKEITELKQQKKNVVIAEEAKRLKVVRNSFIVGFVLMFILVLVILRNFLQKHKANSILTAHKKRIETKNQQLQLQKEEIQTFAKELEKANSTKDKFFSIIAHDLKSPFNTMIGFSELLVNKFDTYNVQEQKNFVSILNQDIHNTFRLLENLLLWSRSHRGKIEFVPVKENLFLLLNETIKLLNQTATNKLITIKNEVAKSIFVSADKDMLETILRNLILNAIKFTKNEGKITINAHLIIDEHKQSCTQISVKDNGVGIAKEKLARLFIISENVSTKGTQGEVGTGLGLTLCKEFVEKHGGKIWVESEEGYGSEFIFTLPTSTLQIR